MSIDVTIPGSDGWWMNHLWQQLRAKQPRLQRLANYREGRPNIVNGNEATMSAFYRFQNMARSNYADLIVQALVERVKVRSIHTAATTDDDGDVQAWAMWRASGMPVYFADVASDVATFGEGYTSECAPDEDSRYSRIVAEDPREFITAQDPENPRNSIAAFKLFHDDVAGVDYAILWVPGRKVVAFMPRKTRVSASIGADGRLAGPKIAFSPTNFTIRPEQSAVDEIDPADETNSLLWSESYTVQDVPAQRHFARDGVGVFERHTDILDRINNMILKRLIIVTLQAHKQRALKLNAALPEYDDKGQKIDYDKVFEADPGALWQLPIGSDIWESTPGDVTGILAGTKADVMELASLTRTPFSMLSSDSVNQSAEGAQLTREGLVFKVEDFETIETMFLVDALSVGFKFMPDDVRYVLSPDGVTKIDRADPAGMDIDWAPAERYSLAEKSQADSQAVSLSRRARLRLIWGLQPAEIDQIMAEVAEDALLAPLAAPKTVVQNNDSPVPA